MRYPRFRFRPSQADALHVDLWHDGVNILRDAGTYSYNEAGSEWFGGTAAHNTVSFDDRDQMPRLGRFLFGDWLAAEKVEQISQGRNGIKAAAGYIDRHGSRHFRTVTLTKCAFRCVDEVEGDFLAAKLYWRLGLENWKLSQSAIQNSTATISIIVEDQPEVRPILATTWESRYYQLKNEVPQICVTVQRPSKIITEVTF